MLRPGFTIYREHLSEVFMERLFGTYAPAGEDPVAAVRDDGRLPRERQRRVLTVRFAPGRLLDFRGEIFDDRHVPFRSLDTAHGGRVRSMLACQFVLFGNLTAEGAKHFFSHSEAGWVRQEASPVIEREFARSAVRFAERPQPAAGRAGSGEGQGSGRANAVGG